MNACNDGVELNLRTVFEVAGAHLRTLIFTAVLGMVLAITAASFLVPTQYQSSVMFYVNNGSAGAEASASVSSGDLSTARNLVDSYIVILKTREALLEVIRQAGVDVPYLELEDMISASAVNKTEFFRVTVTGPDPYQAEKIANAIGEVLPGRIAAIIEGTTARVVEPAVAAWKPISLGLGRYALLGFLGGLALSLGALLLRELAEGPVWNEADIRKACPYPLLTPMPKTRYFPRRKQAGAQTEEVYEQVCEKLALSFADESPCRILGICNPMEVSGKNGAAEALARALSRQGKTVLLIDAEMTGSGHRPGLSEFLAGQCGWEALLQKSEEGFAVIPGGTAPPDPMVLLRSDRMKAFLTYRRQHFDHILLDLGARQRAPALAQSLDGLLLTVQRGKCTRRELKAAAEALDAGPVRVLGILVTSGKDA